ncbi:protein amnionless isoform X1 [Dromaius novaehollandiae]|uniref:protein amnionless isoform X1 n=1 Tax=Dromaius novaehollandiae TaxID=8790 RepID=UPI00311EBF01
MKSLFFLLGCLQLLAAAVAVYKQWLPNTNFETASNWDKGRAPCASDVIHFERDKVVSVFVKSPHPVKDMYLPLDGEFILASGAGFAAFDGSWDPGCDSGSAISFGDADGLAWFDPALWQTAASPGELQPGGRIFAVDEERVPCQYDDVIFQPETSFRVNVDSSQGMIHLRSISLMGQTFSSPTAWAEYLRGPSAPRQFHGNGTFQVSGAGCPDKSGCICGNTQDGPRVCAALLGSAGRPCPAPTCRSPLQPLGHCCGVCGATVCLEFTPDFDLQKYQDRLVQAFLSLPEYAGVQMAISKVLKAQTFLGVALRSSTPVIQIVLIDDRTGLQTGTAAEQMAADIMSDIAQHGEALGISSSKMEVATGSIFSAQTGISTSRKILTGTVLSLLFSLLLLGGMLFLYKRGTLRLRAVRLPRLWGGAQGLASPEPASSKGFDNPMFDVPTDTGEPPGAAFFEDTRPETALKDNQVFYLNPLYDESEVDT